MYFQDTLKKLRSSKANPVIQVNGNMVWDYKIVDDQLRLISEPIFTFDTSDTVTLKELKEYVESEGNPSVRIVSETSGVEMNNIDLSLSDIFNFTAV